MWLKSIIPCTLKEISEGIVPSSSYSLGYLLSNLDWLVQTSSVQAFNLSFDYHKRMHIILLSLKNPNHSILFKILYFF